MKDSSRGNPRAIRNIISHIKIINLKGGKSYNG